MSWTTPQNVLDRWVGGGAPTDENLVQALIDDAEVVILSKYPRIQERIDAETLPLATVVLVVVRMVSRQLRNPEGLTYSQTTTGPFGQARNYGSAAQGISLSEDEEALLSPKAKGKAFEVNLAPHAGLSAISRLTGDQLEDLETVGLVSDED